MRTRKKNTPCVIRSTNARQSNSTSFGESIKLFFKKKKGDSIRGAEPQYNAYHPNGGASVNYAQTPQRVPAAPAAPIEPAAPVAPAAPAAPAAPTVPLVSIAPEVDLAPEIVVIFESNGETHRVPVQQFPCKIGRDSAAVQLPLPDPKTSRIHAELSYGDGAFFLRDLQSANGTFVNGEKITGAVKLSLDDEVVVGLTRLRFEAQE